jgi:GT2 family glycosyltransferase
LGELVAVVIVSYNGRDLLKQCLQSILASPDVPPQAHIIVVDNGSTDGTLYMLRDEFAGVTVIPLRQNQGFAGGNNVGFGYVRTRLPLVRYVALLNQDTIVRPMWLVALYQLAEQRPDAGSIQAKLLLHPETALLNSAGNESHYLGFGFVSGYREEDCGQYDQVRELAFCSGAAMLVRVGAIGSAPRPRGGGLFDDQYFAYLEDAELGWYLRFTGYTNLFCPDSVVMHRYQFNRNPRMYYRLERNRWRLLLTYYRRPTLLLLMPMLLVMELGLLYYFWRVGALREKLRSWDVLNEWPLHISERYHMQKLRTLSDRGFTRPFVAKVRFAEVRNWLLSGVGNPLLGFYWKCVRLVLWW